MNLRLCPTCHQLFPPGIALCPEHGVPLEDDPLLGESVCGYQVVSCLAEGLYAAVQPGNTHDAQVAVRLLPQAVSERHTLQQLLSELRKIAARGEGVAVSPLDGGLLRDGRLFYLFSFSRESGAEPLQARLHTAPRPLEEALRIACAVCAALEAAHRVGFTHGSLGGDTILLHSRPGQAQLRVQLLDLGLSNAADSAQRSGAPSIDSAQRSGAPSIDSAQRSGAPSTGGPPDPAEDVYAVGALLYHLATGAPVRTATAFAGSQLPAEFQAVVLRALAQRPEDRHTSVAALHKDLLALSREGQRRLRSRRPSRVSTVLVGATVLALLVALSTSALLIYEARRPRGGPRAADGGSEVATAAAGMIPGPGPTARHAPPPAEPRESETWLVPLRLRAQALGILRESARSAEAEGRLAAAEILGHSRDRRLLPQAEDLLGDMDPAVATRAAWALGQLGDPAAAVALEQASAELKGVLEVGVSLVQLGDRRGLDLLRVVLRGKKDADRLEAALWLGEHGEAEAWRVLRRLLTQAQDEDPLRHLTILGRLCRGRDQAACQQLRDRLQSKGGTARGQARLLAGAGLMLAGEGLGYDVLHELAGDPALRLSALRALSEAELLPDEERWLAQVLAGEKTAPSVPPEVARGRAAEALGLSGALSALPALGAALSDPDLGVRRAAAAAVLRLSSLEPRLLRGRALDWAQAGISAARPAVRAAAVATLSLGPTALAVPLLVQLLSDRDAELRALAAQGLGLAQTDEGQRALAQALLDRDGNVRVAALRALAQAHELPAEVRQQMEGGSMLEQVAVAGVLLGRGERDGRGVLAQAIQSPDVAVRRLAMEQARSEADEARRANLYGQAVSDAADEVRLLAAVGLARSGDRRGLEVLKAQSGMTLSQRLQARDALSRLKEAQPSLDLVAALGAAGEGQRAAAVQVAPELLPETGLLLVRRGLRDPAQSVRLQAVAAAAGLPVERRVREQLLLQVCFDLDPAVQGRALGLLARMLEPDTRT